MTERIAGGRDNAQLLYFTSSSLSADDTALFFLSDRTGSPNVFSMDLKTGCTIQLTDNTEGYLKSYVYFDGTPHRGLGKASVCLDPARKTVYYLQGDEIRRADGGGLRTLNTVRNGETTAFCAVSADGTRLCVPTTDARALDYGTIQGNKVPYNIDERVQAENLSSYLNVYDTLTGALLLRERVPGAWVTHVQFHPLHAGVILYNHEWPCRDCGIRRMWLFDGQSHRRVRTEGEGRSRGDWTCHEMFGADGSSLIYHGTYRDGPAYLGKCDLASGRLTEIPLDASFRAYGHFTLRSETLLTTDGYYQEPGEAPSSCGRYLSLVHPDWERGALRWTPLCLHGSSWSSQDAHPHPIFDHAGRFVYFTSDCSGRLAVYRAAVPSEP